jgi:hypothetical protein
LEGIARRKNRDLRKATRKNGGNESIKKLKFFVIMLAVNVQREEKLPPASREFPGMIYFQYNTAPTNNGGYSKTRQKNENIFIK